MPSKIISLRSLLLNVTAFAACACAAASELPEAVRLALAEAGAEPESLHASVIPLSPGAPLPAFEWGADEPVLTASVFKVVTTAAAMDLMGPARSWETGFFAEKAQGRPETAAALFIRASGAPWIPVSEFREAVQRLRQAGISRIEGPLVIDRSIFAEPAVDPARFDGSADRPYNQGHDALALGLQSVTYAFEPDPAAGIARVFRDPEIPGYAAPSEIALSGGDCPPNLTRALKPEADESGIRFQGTYPAVCGARSWSAVPWPAAAPGDRYDGRVFRSLWEASGGTWTGEARTGSVPGDAGFLFSLRSKPLSDFVKDINKNSINPMARNLFLLIGAPETGGATLEASRARLSAWLEEKGIGAAGFAPDNGSGLSRTERASARQIAGTLRAAFEAPWAPEFMASLPIAGTDGTMKRRPLGVGSARVKTGYIRGVRSVAGYVKAASGHWYAVCAIINSPAALGARPALDALLEEVARAG